MDMGLPKGLERPLATPRHLGPSERERFEAYLSEILRSLGMDLSEEGTRGTPARLLQAWIDSTSGYEPDPKLLTTFAHEPMEGENGAAAQVVEGPIAFSALCEHHVLPFFGVAWVAYIPRDRVIGLSKLTRLVRRYSRRFTMQERMGRQVAASLHSMLDARGTAVRLHAFHSCTRMRGVCESESWTSTLAWRGDYESSEGLRREFLALASRG